MSFSRKYSRFWCARAPAGLLYLSTARWTRQEAKDALALTAHPHDWPSLKDAGWTVVRCCIE
jgi:hypothetical protein